MATHIYRVTELIKSSSPVVMGILNVTPDSFSDGGEYDRVDKAVDHAMQMIEQGADIIDIGGESTRPGAEPVDVQQECDRVLPVIEALRSRSDIPISIDTSKSEVMYAAIKAGASMVNDVNALQAEEAMATCATLQVPVCLMHMQGEPRTMQQSPQYDDVVQDVRAFLKQRAEECVAAGINSECIVIDPGFGFGKTLVHNVQLLTGLNAICELNYPVLAGLSRKSMLAAILDTEAAKDPLNRVDASVAAAVLARIHGASWFRVHDVQQTVDALKVVQRVEANINEHDT